jgi:phage baseplate assembly protein W
MTTPFDRNLTGYRFALTEYGDTLLTVAARELDDATRWAELIPLNGMIYPWLTDDQNAVKDGVFLNGSYISVPSSTPGAQTNDPGIVFGTDILLTNGLFTFINGDIATVEGKPNLKQALVNALNTDEGELIMHPTYGSDIRSLIGSINIPAATLLAAQYANDTISADSRIDSVIDSVAKSVGDSIKVDVTAMTIQGTTTEAGVTY